MVARADLRAFSAFILELNERCHVDDVIGLLSWSVDTLGQATDCDSNWAGWADLSRDNVEVCGSVMRNLPADFFTFWSQIKKDDLLARDVIDTGCDYASYNRQGSRHTDGMVALSDRYRIDKLSVIVADHKRTPISLFMSCYRSGRSARPLEPDQLGFLRAALDHVQFAIDRNVRGDSKAAYLLVNGSGRVLTASTEALRALKELWPGWRGDLLPSPPPPIETNGIACIGNTRFACHRASQLSTPPLYYLRLLDKDPRGSLTQREREVVDHIVDGLTHKEIARSLGISPATVRNHTQAVLTKLGARNKAALIKLVHSSASS